MFLILFFALFGWTIAEATRRGAREALWRSWLLTLLVLPSWLVAQSGALTYDLRTASELAVLIGFALSPPKDGPPARFLLADLLAIGLSSSIIISQYQVGHFGPLAGPDIVRKWLLPYLMGRFFLGSAADIGRVLPIFARMVAWMSVLAMVEAVVKFNIINKVLGKTFSLLEEGEGYRWGMKRAQGNLEHPIFFGMLLVMIFPWTVEAFRRARQGRGPRWWRYLPLLIGGALFATVSRGPQIAALFTFAATVFFRKKRWRLPILAGGLALAVSVYVLKEQAVDGLSQMAGEKGGEPILIVLDGEEVEYTGTNHRILLFSVYRDTFHRLGLFGYGAELRGINLEEDIAQRFGSIDNHYMLFLLQYGYVSEGIFLALALCTAYYLGRAGWKGGPAPSGLAGSLCGAMLAVAVLLVSVWFAPDFGTAWLFCAGLASNIRTLAPEAAPEEKDAPVPEEAPAAIRLVPRLFPGYAPRPGDHAGLERGAGARPGGADRLLG
jgi:hypothetical protein